MNKNEKTKTNLIVKVLSKSHSVRSKEFIPEY